MNARAAGFTLLEMAIVVAIVGLLGLLVGSAYAKLGDRRSREQAMAQTEAARQALRGFMLAHKRLPCPDRTARGFEDQPCPAGQTMGWLPYQTLGLPPPTDLTRMIYGVYRRGTDADLVVPAGGAAGGVDFEDTGSLVRTLSLVAQQAAASTAEPYLTGDGSARYGTEGCGNAVVNPAFVLVAPVTDKDNNGSGFDGVNPVVPGSGTLCIASDARVPDATYDDVVAAEGAQALLGWLSAQTR
jgi:prepilin-type N-terminal cleavage/methylation domain-containing protein